MIVNKLIGACWSITTDCNMQCPVCNSYNEKAGLSFDDKKRIIDILVNNQIRKITFAGGEPLLDKYIFSLIDYAYNKGIKTSLATNGLLLNSNVLKKVNGHLIELLLPLDGSNAKIHTLHRSSQEHFVKIKNLFKIIQKYNIDTSVLTVATKQNLSDLINIAEIILESGIKRWRVFKFLPIGRGYINKDRFEIPESDFIMVKNLISDKVKGLDIDFGSNNEERLKSYLNISPNGNIFWACRNSYRYIYNVFGNLFSAKDLCFTLKKAGFNWKVHGRRHWRDKGRRYEKRKSNIGYY